MQPDIPSTEKEKEEAEKVYADLVKIYPENKSYLRSYAEILLANEKVSTAISVLKKLHSLLQKDSPDKASALAREFPQIGRITKVEEEQNGDSKLGEMIRNSLGTLWIKMHQKRVKEGQRLYKEKEHGDSLALVIKGEMAVFMSDNKHTNILLNLIGPNDVIGEGCFLNPGLRTADVVANKDSIIVEIPRNKLISYFIENPGAEKILEDKADLRQMTSMLSRNELLRDIPLDMRKYMAGTTKTVRYKPKTLIRRAGQEMDAVDMLIWGEANYLMQNENKKYRRMGKFMAGELLGDASALRKATCPADIASVSEVLMAHIPLSSFINVVEAYPPFKEKLLHHAQKQRAKIMRMVAKLGNSKKNHASD